MFSAQMPFTVLSEDFISGFNEGGAVSDAAAFMRAVTFYAEPSAPDWGVGSQWGAGGGVVAATVQ